MSVILAMILGTGITTNSPAIDLRYYTKSIAFRDITDLTRLCNVSGQYGIYFKGKAAFQVSACGTDTLFKTGMEVGETNKPKPGVTFP